MTDPIAGDRGVDLRSAVRCRVVHALLAFPLAVLAGCGDGQDARPPIRVARIVRDFLTEPRSWETLHTRTDSAPRVETICPSVSPEIDGADMPALVMEPPVAVRFEVLPDQVPARLVSRVGVDQTTFGVLRPERPRAHFVFELLAGEHSLAREEIEITLGEHGTNAWRDLGGSRGVTLEHAGPITLRVECLDDAGAPVVPELALLAGFGGLRLERAFELPRTRSSPDHPNVVLVVMDTLRADRLSCYGCPRPTSPRLDALASRGTLVEELYSTSSWTWPATASLLTGLTPLEHGLVNEGSSYLAETLTTLAEALQEEGLTTAAWSANPIVSAQRNFDQGFERFSSPPERFLKTQELFEEVRAFLAEQGDTRFFLYLHLADPHTPLRPLAEARSLLAAGVPEEFIERSDGLWHATALGQAIRPGGTLEFDGIATEEERRWVGELYDASVRSGDAWLGRLLDELAALDLSRRTIVAFTADHGEELFERGILGHGQSLRRELVHVPLVVAGPGVPSGRRHAGATTACVLAPLLAGLAGASFDGADEVQSFLAGGGGQHRGPVVFTTTKGIWKGRRRVRILGLVEGDWKLDLALNGAPWGTDVVPEAGDLELFDLRSDPGERNDLAAIRPEEARRLRELLLERKEVLESRRVGADIPAGGATMRILEQIGYIGGKH